MTRKEKEHFAIARMTLRQKTLMYWSLSLACNKQIGPCAGVTTEDAIHRLTGIEDTTVYTKPLRDKATELLDGIIGVRKPAKVVVGTNHMKTAHDEGVYSWNDWNDVPPKGAA